MGAQSRNFEFVVSNGPKPPKDPALWTKIRKQAMRDVAIARRKRGKANIKSSCSDSSQEWTTDESSESSSPQSSTDLIRADADCGQWSFDDFDIMQLNLTTPYETLRATYNADIQDLAALTCCFGVSSTTVTNLGNNKLLNACLGHGIDTYLSYIPSRYGMSTVITAAVDCVTAKLASRMSPNNTALYAKSVELYEAALREVQACISDKQACMEADTLCSVKLLTLHEFLDPDHVDAWKQHVAGAAQLIRLRSPSRFNTDFDMALFFGGIGIECTEALREARGCYIDTPEWRKICFQYSKESTWLGSRHPLVVFTRLTEARLPGLMVDVTTSVVSGEVFDMTAVVPLQKRCEGLHEELLKCLEDYKGHLVSTSLLPPPQLEIDFRRELIGGITECLLVAKRLVAATHENQRLRLENEAQALALLLLDMQRGPTPRYAWIFTGIELGLVNCMKVTRELWEEDVSQKTSEEQRAAAVTRWIAFITKAGQWEQRGPEFGTPET